MARRRRSGTARRPRSATARSPHSRAARRPWLAFTVTLALLAGVTGGVWGVLSLADFPRPTGRCTAATTDGTFSLAADQSAGAALLSALAVDRGMPARAATIAIATAMQESKLRNIDYGDRDSVGLFQQRPSQGWGSVEQIMDPIYATTAFYDALEQVPDYEDREITDAAQRVQRSAYPDAYAQHEPTARAFASALTGHSGLELSCDLADATAPGSPLAVAGALAAQFPGAVEEQIVPATAVLTGAEREQFAAGPTALDVEVSGERWAWVVANWAVAQAGAHGIVAVATHDAVWQRGGAEPGWQRGADPVTPDSTSAGSMGAGSTSADSMGAGSMSSVSENTVRILFATGS